MAIRKEVDGVYKDVADALTPVIGGARKSFKAVRTKVDGAWKDLWNSMKTASVELFDDYYGENLYEAKVLLDDNNLLVTHMLSSYGGNQLTHTTISVICDNINVVSPIVTFELSAVFADADSDVNIYVGYYYSDGTHTTSYPFTWDSLSTDYTSLANDGDLIYDEGAQINRSIQSTSKDTTKTVTKIVIRVNSYGYYDDDYDSTNEFISLWLKNICINGVKYGGSYLYNNLYTDVTKFESYHK